MSIRINNDGLAGAAASQTDRAQESALGSADESRFRAGFGSGGADRVEISSLSESIAAASHADKIQQSARVSQLAALYRSGQYSVDSVQLSRTIVAQALNLSAAENGG